MIFASAKVSARAEEFIASVLRLRPKVAVFDCDGTLWDGDMGAGFFYWEIEQALIPREVADWALPRYTDYKAGRVDEETMCGEMVTIHAGITEEKIIAAAAHFFEIEVRQRIFPEMQRLTGRLADAGCELWAVSSTSEWVIRAAAPHFGFSPDRVLAACVAIEAGCATDKLIRVPTDEGKAVIVRERIGPCPDAVLGNSIHDAAMLELARHPFAINPNPDLAELAKQRRWTIYRPDAV
ncbi:MAG TPA: haloacid dehalogenase-like hydrolase [Terriglobales bacterium]|nr:haloacid dehalogenase-like hydrolase [Terriglobales bacterium]